MAKTILVVDDVAFVRKTISDILTKAHYKVVGEASDGEQAIAMYAQFRPDLVTMDVVMPKLSGIEAARKIIKQDKDAKIVFVSAMGQENLVMEAINVGARDYIVKPFNATDLLRTVERAFSDELGGRPISRESRAGTGS